MKYLAGHLIKLLKDIFCFFSFLVFDFEPHLTAQGLFLIGLETQGTPNPGWPYPLYYLSSSLKIYILNQDTSGCVCMPLAVSTHDLLAGKLLPPCPESPIQAQGNCTKTCSLETFASEILRGFGSEVDFRNPTRAALLRPENYVLVKSLGCGDHP